MRLSNYSYRPRVLAQTPSSILHSHSNSIAHPLDLGAPNLIDATSS
jgi:hypothetical protein